MTDNIPRWKLLVLGVGLAVVVAAGVGGLTYGLLDDDDETTLSLTGNSASDGKVTPEPDEVTTCDPGNTACTGVNDIDPMIRNR